MPPEPSPSIENRITQIFAARQFDQSDRAFLTTTLASGNINDADEALINRIYDAIAAGKISVVA